MEILKNKFLVKLIAAVCLLLAVFNFSGATKVYAADDDDLGWGGVLIKPITSLMTAIGDAIMDILHDAIRKQDTSIVKISGDTNWAAFWKTVAVVVVAIVAAVLFVVAAAATAGLANAALGVLAGGTFAFSMGTVGVGTLVGGAVVGICVGVRAGDAWFPDDIYLPAFTISAEEIFANRVPLFDVNFFNPMPAQEVIVGSSVENKTVERLTVYYDVSDSTDQVWEDGINDMDILIGPEETVVSNDIYKYDCLVNDMCALYPGRITTVNGLFEMLEGHVNQEKTTNTLSNILNRIDAALVNKGVGEINRDQENSTSLNRSQVTIQGSNETYNTGRISILHGGDQSTGPKEVIILFTTVNKTETTPVTENLNSTAAQLKNVISTWYFILRNIALLVLMLLLIYSGIRIVIGSTAGEKAKYKERIIDWLVAICLVMIMHYIMVFAVELVDQITQVIRSSENKNTNAAYIPLSNNQWNNASEMDWTEFGGQENLFVDDSSAESGKALVWQTDLVGLFRIQAQFENEGTAKWVGYSFCYVVLVLLTLFFAFTYIKRILYMAFLTIIAPLVAMTYPIDKITDGKAQAFDSWLKEYIFNLMIQPLHLLLYTILVTSAFQLASNNPIYALVALGFIMPAEKLMRRFFGFEKAKTPGLLGGAAGAAIAMSGLQGLLKHKPNGGKSDGGKGKLSDSNKVRFSNKNKGNAMDDITGMTAVAEGNTAGNVVQRPSRSGRQQRTQQAINSSQARVSLDTGALGENDTNQEAVGSYAFDGEFTTNGEDSNFDNNLDNNFNNNFDNNFDDDDIFANTTLGMDEWEHDGFGIDNLGDGPQNPGSIRISGVTTEERNADQQEEEDAEENDSGKEHKRSIMRAIGVATLGVGKQAAIGVLTGVHPLRFAGKVAAGATAATAGLLIGTASGDPSKAFQYTTAGAMAGSALANSLSGRPGLDTEKVKEEYEMAYYGPDYKEKLIEKQKDEFKTSSENINYLRQVMGVTHKEARDILESTGSECFDNGITDIKDIATIHQLTHPKDKKDKMSFKKAAAARTYAKRRLGGADVDQMTEDTVEEYKKRWTREFKDRYKISQKDARNLAEKSFDAAIKFNKTYSGLTKFSK